MPAQNDLTSLSSRIDRLKLIIKQSQQNLPEQSKLSYFDKIIPYSTQAKNSPQPLLSLRSKTQFPSVSYFNQFQHTEPLVNLRITPSQISYKAEPKWSPVAVTRVSQMLLKMTTDQINKKFDIKAELFKSKSKFEQILRKK